MKRVIMTTTEINNEDITDENNKRRNKKLRIKNLSPNTNSLSALLCSLAARSPSSEWICINTDDKRDGRGNEKKIKTREMKCTKNSNKNSKTKNG